jgi:hypothetical protein
MIGINTKTGTTESIVDDCITFSDTLLARYADLYNIRVCRAAQQLVEYFPDTANLIDHPTLKLPTNTDTVRRFTWMHHWEEKGNSTS